MDNGLACSDGGLLTVHDVEDGGWYWIHDQDNAAVSPLIASDILGNANNVMPLNPGGVTVLETSDYASYVRHEPSGRVGIMNRILPVPTWSARRRLYVSATSVMTTVYSIARGSSASTAWRRTTKMATQSPTGPPCTARMPRTRRNTVREWSLRATVSFVPPPM